MDKYLYHTSLIATKGNGDKLASILLEASKLVPKVKGCNLYIISKDKNQNDIIWVTEIWDSKEEHDNSLKTEGVRELIFSAMPILDGLPEKGQELEIKGGTGIS